MSNAITSKAEGLICDPILLVLRSLGVAWFATITLAVLWRASTAFTLDLAAPISADHFSAAATMRLLVVALIAGWMLCRSAAAPLVRRLGWGLWGCSWIFVARTAFAPNAADFLLVTTLFALIPLAQIAISEVRRPKFVLG